MRVAMIGTGYVGLVTGACLAEFGFDVACVDMDPDKIARLGRGEIPIYEPGLDRVVARNAAEGRLGFTTLLAPAVAEADVVFLAVGTPTRSDDGHADLSHVFAAARDVARAIRGYTVIVTKSTVSVGTGREVARTVRETRPDAEFDVVSNPEFLREGSGVEDFLRPDRVVIGTDSPRAREVMRHLYRPLERIETPILFTSLETAELIKYAANSFLATKIAFINEIADLCDRVGADVHHVARGIGLDERIGARFLQPGPGYGGSCFPKDTLALATKARAVGAPQRIVEATIAANDARKQGMAARVVDACGGSVAGQRIAVLGVTFKADTDDMRDAPSLAILPALQAAGATVCAYDPQGAAAAERLLPGVAWARTAYEAAHGADAVLVLTEWNEFRGLQLRRLRAEMRGDVMVDLRNLYEPDEATAAGFRYRGIGRRGMPAPVPLRAGELRRGELIEIARPDYRVAPARKPATRHAT